MITKVTTWSCRFTTMAIWSEPCEHAGQAWTHQNYVTSCLWSNVSTRAWRASPESRHFSSNQTLANTVEYSYSCLHFHFANKNWFFFHKTVSFRIPSLFSVATLRKHEQFILLRWSCQANLFSARRWGFPDEACSGYQPRFWQLIRNFDSWSEEYRVMS